MVLDDTDSLKIRPVNRWRLNNVQTVLRLLHSDELTARSVLSEAIAAEETGGKKRSEKKKIEDAKDRLRRNLKHGGTFTNEYTEKVEAGCRRLARTGKLPPLYTRPGVLDQRNASPNVVYIHATINAPGWPRICADLETIPEVQEASLVYGSADVDAIIKIEASIERVNEIMMKHIQPSNHILHTQTLQSVAASRWQREQQAWDMAENSFVWDEAQKLQDIEDVGVDADAGEPSIFNNDRLQMSEALKGMFLREMEGKISTLRKMKEGRLRLKRSDSLEGFPANLIDTAMKGIAAVVVVKDIPDGECKRILRYLDAQHRRKQQRKGRFQIRRIFVVDDVNALHDNESLSGRIGAELHREIDVRYLAAQDWPKARRNAHPLDLGILDDTVSWEVLSEPNDEQLRVIDISVQDDDIQERQHDYEFLWEKARKLSPELVRKCKASRTTFEYLCGGSD